MDDWACWWWSGQLGGACRMSRSCCRAALWLSVSRANGELADGLCNAMVMSEIPAKMRSMDKAVGMGHLVGNQVSVSQMHCTHVSVIHMVLQWYECRAGPKHHPARLCGAQVCWALGFS